MQLVPGLGHHHHRARRRGRVRAAAGSPRGRSGRTPRRRRRSARTGAGRARVTNCWRTILNPSSNPPAVVAGLASRLLGRLDRAVDVVQHRQDVLHQRRTGVLPLLGQLARLPRQRVLQLRLQAAARGPSRSRAAPRRSARPPGFGRFIAHLGVERRVVERRSSRRRSDQLQDGRRRPSVEFSYCLSLRSREIGG